MRRIMIAGTNSGCGKTTITCAVLQALVNRGVDAAAFKCGPDYIDPMFHSRIIGARSRNLDGWLCDKNTVNYLLQKNSGEISVIEGVMGFYDGAGEAASSHRMALDTRTPAVVVVDCKGMSLSVGAVMKGFLSFRQPNNIAGFIFNRLPESQTDTAKTLCSELGTEYFGRFPYSKDCAIESRHLGLVTADEVEGLKEKTWQLAELAEEHILLDKLLELAERAEAVDFDPPKLPQSKGKPPKIAVARDSAFCFYYEDSLDLLRELGCELAEFSPLTDKGLPEGVQGLLIGGGYPELYAEGLSSNVAMLDDLREKITAGLPTIAECGGFMYLHRSMEDNNGIPHRMVGVINADAYKTRRLQRFGYVTLTADENGLLLNRGGKIRAHEFHYWDSTEPGKDFGAEKINGFSYRCGHCGPALYAAFPHLHFYGNIEAAANFVRKCQEYGNG